MNLGNSMHPFPLILMDFIKVVSSYISLYCSFKCRIMLFDRKFSKTIPVKSDAVFAKIVNPFFLTSKFLKNRIAHE